MGLSDKLSCLCLGCMETLPQPGMVCPHCGFDVSTYVPQPQEMPAGTVLAGKYLVGRALGQGGFGITYVGWDINLDIKVAIKEYFPEGCVSRDQNTHTTLHTFSGDRADAFAAGRDRFVSEARTVAKFSKLPNIVNVRDFFQENGTAYIVMEFVEGVTLQQYARQQGGRLSAQDILPRMAPLIESLARLHDGGMLHRDISPDNIMLQPDGTLKLLDFGAARQMSLTGERNNTINVKHGFAPEEQYRTHGEQGPWTDVYALCATIYRLLTGVTPVQSMDRLVSNDTLVPPSRLGADVTPQQEAAILHGMAVLARDRTPDMRALYRELYGTGMQTPVAAQPAQQNVQAVRTGGGQQLLSEMIACWPGNVGDAGVAAMLLPVARQLQTLHESGRLCLMLSPDMLRVTDNGCTIDWQRSVRPTTAFLAPEQMNGGNAGPATDTYALCAIMNLLCGADGRTPQPGSMMDWLLARGLAQNPAARFQSMGELAGYLQTLAASAPQRSTQQHTDGAKKKKNRTGLIIAAAAVGVLGLIAALFPYKRIAYAKAIEQAIIDCDTIPFSAENIYKQLGDQMKQARENPDRPNFTIDIEIPDYASLDINTIDYETPAVDWSDPTKEAYMGALRSALTEGVRVSGITPDTVPATLSVSLSKQDGEWRGSIGEESVREVEERLDGMIDEQLSKLNQLPIELELIGVAERKDMILSALVSDQGYLDAVKVVMVEKTGDDTYRVDLSYPDPIGVFEAIASAYESNVTRRIFAREVPPLELAAFASLPGTFSGKTGAVTVQHSEGSNDYTLIDGGSFFTDLDSAKTAAQEASADRIFEKFGIPTESRPSNCRLMLGSESGATSFKVTLGSYAEDCYVILYQAGSDTLQSAIWVKSNYTVTLPIPIGTYRIVFAYGNTWYGTKYMFGPEGRYLEITQEIPSTGWQYTINSWTGGGIDWHEIPYDVDLTA